MRFSVGQKVVCIRDVNWECIYCYTSNGNHPIKDSIYTADGYERGNFLLLKEMPNAACSCSARDSYDDCEFAPIEYIRTDLSNELIQLSQETLTI